MLLRVAVKMLLAKKIRLFSTVFGLAMLFLLSACQVGLLVGWCHTITAIPRHAGVDIWVMNQGTVAWDYGTPLPRHRIYQVRNVAGVEWTEGIYVGWSKWQRPDGLRLNVQVVGIDRSSVGGPWDLREGCVEDLHLPDKVIIDEAYRAMLGVKETGAEVELQGKKAMVCGFCRDVRTITAAPFVFTSMRTARKYDKAINPDETTYVLARCAPGADPVAVARRITEEVPGVEALTTPAVMVRSVRYWLVDSGIGVIFVLTALLGLGVSAVVTGQTLFNITQDHLANYATLLALGFSRLWLLGCVLAQGLFLGGLGVLLGSLMVLGISAASAHSRTPVEFIPLVLGGLVALAVGSCLIGSYLAVKAVLRIDPVAVFRA